MLTHFFFSLPLVHLQIDLNTHVIIKYLLIEHMVN